MKNLLYLFLVVSLAFSLTSCNQEAIVLEANLEQEFNDATLALEEVKTLTETGLELEEALVIIITQSNEEVGYFLSRVLAGIGLEKLEFYPKNMQIIKLSEVELENRKNVGRRYKKWFSIISKIRPHGCGSADDGFTFAAANCL